VGRRAGLDGCEKSRPSPGFDTWTQFRRRQQKVSFVTDLTV